MTLSSSLANASVLTVIVGMMGIILGTFLSPYLNNRLNLKSRRRELFFNKRLEYFENIAKTMEENIKMYHNYLSQLKLKESKKEIEKIFSKLKEERKKFNISASPLYFDTRKLSKRIVIFTNFEKRIFFDINKLTEENKPNERLLHDLDVNLERLKQAGTEVIKRMKKEMYQN